MLFSIPTYRFYSLLLVAVGIAVFTGCRKIPKFSETPSIQYKNIRKVTFFSEDQLIDSDSIILGLHFEDGDGDLGASSEERSDPAFTGPYGNWGNYELVTARKGANGQWTESILAGDSLKWMPILKPDNKPGPIKGKLDLNTSFLYGNSTVPITLKFKVRIRDRALRVSNQIETDSVVVPGYR